MENEAFESLVSTLANLRSNKPNDRSEKDRYWAITITQLEIAISVFYFNVVMPEPPVK